MKKYLMSLPRWKEERNFYQHLFSYSEFAWDTLNHCRSILDDVVFINVGWENSGKRRRTFSSAQQLQMSRVMYHEL